MTHYADGPRSAASVAIRVRAADAADLDRLVLGNRDLARETEGLELDPAIVRAGVRAVLEDPAKGAYVVAERGGEAVGQLLLTSEWSDWNCKRYMWIQSVFVAPSARRGGVYRALHAAVVARAREAGDVAAIRLYVERSNERAQRTYTALGMARSHYDMLELPIA